MPTKQPQLPLEQVACERCHDHRKATYSGIVTNYRFCLECLRNPEWDTRNWEAWFRAHPKKLVRPIGWHEYDE